MVLFFKKSSLMNATILHVFPFQKGTLLFLDGGLTLLIPLGVIVMGIVVGLYLYNESKKESNN